MRKQNGMTLIGMLLTVVVVAMAAIVVMRIVPVYLQYYTILESIKGLNSTPSSSLTGDAFSDVQELKKSLTKRLDINGVEDLRDDQIVISPDGENKFTVKIKYQVVRPLVYNISLLFDFDHTEEVVAGSEN